MKKSLVALAILGSFAGAASAASSVTLYGQVEAEYYDLFGKGEFANGATADVTGLTATQAAVKKSTLATAQGLLSRSLSQKPRRTVIPPKRAASKSRINTSPAFSAGRVSLLKPSYAFALE